MIRRFAFFFVVLWIAGGIAFIFFYARYLQNRPLPELGKVPAFELTDNLGKTFSSDQLSDQPWIADFIFTHCAGPCPMMTATLSHVAKELKDTGVQFVSFSVDPDNDTPKALFDYAANYDVDPERWHFLTGDKRQIYALAIQHFHLAAGPMLAEPPDPAHTILHSTKFVLVGPEGKIRGYYDSLNPNEVHKLGLDARRLAAGALSHAAA